MNDTCGGCRDADMNLESYLIDDGDGAYRRVWKHKCRKEDTCERFKKAKEWFVVEDSWTYAEKVSKELDKEKEDKEKESDNANHPSHYADGCGLECIDIMEAIFGPELVFDYAIVNAFKYLWRYKNKNGQEDIRKAKWYLDKAHELDKKEDFIGSRRNRYWKVQDLYAKVIYKERGKEDGEVQ